jgi:hypothetical protein
VAVTQELFTLNLHCTNNVLSRNTFVDISDENSRAEKEGRSKPSNINMLFFLYSSTRKCVLAMGGGVKGSQAWRVSMDTYETYLQHECVCHDVLTSVVEVRRKAFPEEM